RATGKASGAMPVVRRELVDGWLASSKDVAALPRSIPRVLLLRLPPILALGVLLLVVLAIAGISAFSIWSSPTLRDWVDAWREGRRAIAAPGAPTAPITPVRWATVDSQVARVVPSRIATRDLLLLSQRIAA